MIAEIFPNSINFQKIEILEALVFRKLAGDWNSSSPRYAWDFFPFTWGSPALNGKIRARWRWFSATTVWVTVKNNNIWGSGSGGWIRLSLDPQLNQNVGTRWQRLAKTPSVCRLLWCAYWHHNDSKLDTTSQATAASPVSRRARRLEIDPSSCELK